MPDADDDLETRVTILEREVARLREQNALSSSDATAARVLAAGADHDVSEVRAELRAHTQALNALRETQLEQGRKLDEHSQILNEHSQKLDGHSQKLDGHGRAIVSLDQKMSEGFTTLHTGMAQITALLTKITNSGQD